MKILFISFQKFVLKSKEKKKTFTCNLFLYIIFLHLSSHLRGNKKILHLIPSLARGLQTPSIPKARKKKVKKKLKSTPFNSVQVSK